MRRRFGKSNPQVLVDRLVVEIRRKYGLGVPIREIKKWLDRQKAVVAPLTIQSAVQFESWKRVSAVHSIPESWPSRFAGVEAVTKYRKLAHYLLRHLDPDVPAEAVCRGPIEKWLRKTSKVEHPNTADEIYRIYGERVDFQQQMWRIRRRWRKKGLL